MNKCNHQWRELRSLWIEGCAGAICTVCGEFGCWHDAERAGVDKDTFFREAVENSKCIKINENYRRLD